jgi:hypothetical protein
MHSLAAKDAIFIHGNSIGLIDLHFRSTQTEKERDREIEVVKESSYPLPFADERERE